jgi:hypothetical protein
MVSLGPDEVLVAVDPGSVHVGLAQVRVGPGGYVVWAAERAPHPSIDWLWDLMDPSIPNPRGMRVSEVAIEAFRLRSGTPKGGSRLGEVEVIGAISSIARRYGVPVVEVPPSVRSVATERIRSQGIGWAGRGPHAHDAQAVALAALAAPVAAMVPGREQPPLGWPAEQGER